MRRKPPREQGIEPRRRERLIALALLGALLFNYPLLDLFGSGAVLFGIPLLFLYVFLIWALFLCFVALTLERDSSAESDRAD